MFEVTTILGFCNLLLLSETLDFCWRKWFSKEDALLKRYLYVCQFACGVSLQAYEGDVRT
jgi:hypothetical protein